MEAVADTRFVRILDAHMTVAFRLYSMEFRVIALTSGLPSPHEILGTSSPPFKCVAGLLRHRLDRQEGSSFGPGRVRLEWSLGRGNVILYYMHARFISRWWLSIMRVC